MKKLQQNASSVTSTPLVSIVMQHANDWTILQHAELTLNVLGISNESFIISPQKTPELLRDYGKSIEERGVQVIIAGSSGAAYLPGMLAAYTLVPVLGVPLINANENGLLGIDAVLGMLQMPQGVGVGTFGIGKEGAINSALFAAAILGRSDKRIFEALREFRAGQTKKILDHPDPKMGIFSV